MSGISLELLRHFELRCLALTDFRLLQPPQGGWDLFLERVEAWLATMRWEFGGLWPEELGLCPLSMQLDIVYA